MQLSRMPNDPPAQKSKEASAASSFDVSHERPQLPISAALPRIAAQTGLAPMQIAMEFARLSFGPGRVSLEDYVKYRLFDDSFLNGADKRAFVGQRRNMELMVEINYRFDWLGLLSDKIASASYFGAYGLPIAPVRAIFAPGFATGAPNLLRSRDELRAFLMSAESYPLFGKPAESVQSLGALALSGCDLKSGEVIDLLGARQSVEVLLNDIEAHYSAGYVFQELLQSHRALLPIMGPRIGTVRVVTINTDGGAKVFRAGWKLPANGNIADNFWRSGNLLAGVDLETGCIKRVTSGTGFELRDVTLHPDTAADLIGVGIPDWARMKEIAIEGARLLRHLGMVGWDMAVTDNGPLIVEANNAPDFTLVQLADRRGVLDAEFQEFLARQKREAAGHLKQNKENYLKL
jgi:hypothetical protein